MKLIAGLGNPGVKYLNTRHNTGFLVIDRLKTRIFNNQFPITKQIPNFEIQKKLQSETFLTGNIILAKPQTFMNFSGDAVKSLSTFYHILIPNIWVIHDDLDIKLGSYKIQTKGPKIHNGLLSIYEKIGANNFWHVRVGIENRTPDERRKISGERYVLQEFTGEEKVILDEVIEKVVEELSGVVINNE